MFNELLATKKSRYLALAFLAIVADVAVSIFVIFNSPRLFNEGAQ